MATTNNVQGDEPWPTTLERQVQTITTAVERLTKQNQDLEEQILQKNTAIGIQEEDQEGASKREEIERGQKVVMPQENRNDKTWAANLLLIRLHLTSSQRCKWWKNEWI